jgi:transposase, IS30 family
MSATRTSRSAAPGSPPRSCGCSIANPPGDRAERRLLAWFTDIAEHEIPELVRLARTLDAWRAELLAYFDTGGVSNGPTGAINGLIKKVKRVGWWSQPAVATPVLVIDWKGVCVPGPRLSQQERIRIEAMWISGLTFPEIAAALGRDRSTVWREVRRNHSHTHGFKHAGRVKGQALRSMVVRGSGLYRWGYDAAAAQQRASSRACRPRQVKLGYRPSPRTTVRQYRPRGTASTGWGSGFARGLPTDLRVIVLGKLRRRWSPQQISSWLAVHFAGYPELQVSHETIYQALYVQSRGNLRRELSNQVALRQGRRTRRHRAAAAGAVRSRRPWAEGFNISARPAEVSDRAVPGHWEGDLLLGAGAGSAIVTLVERTSRYVLLGHLPDTRDSGTVVSTLSTLAQRLPSQLFRTLTWDCGTEMSQHRSFTVASDCRVFFADPHSPWQRGSNENTNGLLRQYFPKSRTDFRAISQAQLDDVATELNQRPRQTLSWQTPHDALSALVATAG